MYCHSALYLSSSLCSPDPLLSLLDTPLLLNPTSPHPSLRPCFKFLTSVPQLLLTSPHPPFSLRSASHFSKHHSDPKVLQLIQKCFCLFMPQGQAVLYDTRNYLHHFLRGSLFLSCVYMYTCKYMGARVSVCGGCMFLGVHICTFVCLLAEDRGQT